MAQTSSNHPLPTGSSSKSHISHIERNDGPLSSPVRHGRSTSLDSVASNIILQPPTPDNKSAPSSADVFRSSSRSTTSSLRHAIFADHSSPVTSPDAETSSSVSTPSIKPAPASLGPSVVRPRSSRSPSSSYFSTPSDPSAARTPSGQNVRPPRRRKDTGDLASASPFGSPRTSPSTTPGGSRTTSPKIGGPEPPVLDGRKIAELALKTSKRDADGSPSSSASTTPTSSTPVSSAMNSPLSHFTSLPVSSSSPPSNEPVKSSLQPPAPQAVPKPASLAVLNKRRMAQGRPTLRSSATEAAACALRINLDVLGRPKFDPATQTFVTEHGIPPAPHTTSSASATRPASPLIRKKSGELVKSSLKSSAAPSYDANPLSAASTTSVISDDTSDSPFGYSKSLPATPSCPKYVHFDTRLERVRLFLAEQKPAAVSRGGSPSDENALGGSGSEGFPFPSTSDEDEITRRSLEIRLSNFPLQRPFDADVFLDSLALTEDARSLKGIVHVRNIAFNKRVTIRFTSDCWSTTSEITGSYLDSIKGNTFDRFTFLIKLDDLMSRIEEKTLWLCVRYNVEGREMWDSNEGKNFQIEFRKRKHEGQMKASELRELRRRAATSSGVTRGGNQWSDKAGDGGLSSDRMADLKIQLSRLAADFDSDHDTGIPSPTFRQSPLLAGGVLSPNPSPSPLAARYDFGASLKNPTGWDRTSSAPRAPSTWEAPPATSSSFNSVEPSIMPDDSFSNASSSPLPPPPSAPFPVPADMPPTYASNGPSTDGSSIGLRFDPAAAFGESPRKGATTSSLRLSGLPDTFSNFDRTLSSGAASGSNRSNAPFGSPRELDGFAYSSRSVPSQPEPSTNYLKVLTPGGSLSPTPINSVLAGTMSPAGPPPIARHHARSAYGTQSLDYFSAVNVRRTPPATPGALDSFSGPSSPAARFAAPSPNEAPPPNHRHSSSFSSAASSSSSVSSDLMASSSSGLSTASLYSSLSGTPSPLTPPGPYDDRRSHDPSLSAPRPGMGATGAGGSLNGMSFSDVVNQFCFFTGDRPGSSSSAPLDPNLPSPASTTVSLASEPGISTPLNNPNFSPSSSSDGDLTLDATNSALNLRSSPSAASVDSFFSTGLSSGLTTPTNHKGTPDEGSRLRNEYFPSEAVDAGAEEVQARKGQNVAL